MARPDKYVGVQNEVNGGMTTIGKIIRDAWVFGLIEETETCEGWTGQGIDALYDKVTEAWEPYGHLVSRLPPEVAERHRRIYTEAVRHARDHGWDPELDEGDGA